jgi:hypothetical protein
MNDLLNVKNIKKVIKNVSVIYIQRDDNMIYISDNHFILRIPYETYVAELSKVTGNIMEENQCVMSYNLKDYEFSKNDFTKLFSNVLNTVFNPASVTRWSYETEKAALVRMIVDKEIKNNKVYINNMFLSMINFDSFNVYIYDRVNPVLFVTPDNYTCILIILPVNTTPDYSCFD